MKAYGLKQRQSACETRTSKLNISCLKSGVFNRSQISSVTGWLAVACLATLLISCASKTENEIVGKWDIVLTISATGRYTVHTAAGAETIEFLKNGTVVTVTEEKWPVFGGPAWITKRTKAGDYKFIEKDRIKIQWGGFNAWDGPIVANISISGDKLTLTMPDGRVEKYQRTK